MLFYIMALACIAYNMLYLVFCVKRRLIRASVGTAAAAIIAATGTILLGLFAN